MVSRRIALSRADLDGGLCTIPVPHEGDVTVVLEHAERGIAPTRQVFEASVLPEPEQQLSGIDWPADLRPGVLVTVAWRTAEVLMRTVALAEPMRIDGVDYFHEYDPIVVTREFAPDESNWAKVLHTVRRLGRVFDDGSAVLAESQLAARCGLGRGARGSFLLRNAVDQLLREGYVTRVAGSVDPTGQPSYPAIDAEEPADLLLYAPLVEVAPDPSERRDHWVNGFVRKLPPGAQASRKQRTLHQQTLEQDDLPDGYTFVKRHHRNG